MGNPASLYSKKVMDHFMNPRNMGTIEDADAIATVGNPICGDVMKMYLKVGKKAVKGRQTEYIKDIKFQTLGCGAAIATSSMATELVKGKTLTEAWELSNKAVTEALDGLPRVKIHCSMLAEEGIKGVIEIYREGTKKESSQ